MQRKITAIIIMFLFLAADFGVKAQVREKSIPDSLLQEKSKVAGIERARLDLELARFYFLKDRDSLFHYVAMLDSFLVKNKDIRIEAFIKKFEGYRAELNLEIHQSMVLVRESLVLFHKLDDYKEIGWLHNNLASSYFRLGDFANSTEQCHLAIGFFEKINGYHGIGEAYNNLGRIDFQTGNLEKAKEHFEESLKNFEKLKLESPKYKIYNNLGLIMLDDLDYAQALSNFNKALIGYEKDHDNRRVALVQGNIAICYEELKNRKEALNYARKALNNSILAADKYGIISGYINLGYFLRLEGKYDSSLVYFEDALLLANESHVLVFVNEIYKEFEDFYLDLGDFEEAYAYRTKFDSTQQLLMDVESQQRIEELNFNLKYKLEEQQMNKLIEHQEVQTRLNRILILVIILSLILIVIFIFGYMLNRKQRLQLAEKNDLLNKYNRRLEDSESDLRRLIDDKNKLFSIIAHDLRNPVAAVTGFAELLDQNYSDLDDEKRKEFVGHILQGSNRSMSLLENLLLWARSQMDLIDMKSVDVSVSKLLDESAEPLLSSIEKKELELITEIREDFNLHIDIEMVKVAIRNLLSNAIKFSYPGEQIHLLAFVENGAYCISVADKGVGIDPGKMDKLFSSSNISTTEGTLKEPGSGLGLMISHDYTKKNGGNIQVHSEAGKGSVFTICFPYEAKN